MTEKLTNWNFNGKVIDKGSLGFSCFNCSKTTRYAYEINQRKAVRQVCNKCVITSDFKIEDSEMPLAGEIDNMLWLSIYSGKLLESANYNRLIYLILKIKKEGLLDNEFDFGNILHLLKERKKLSPRQACVLHGMFKKLGDEFDRDIIPLSLMGNAHKEQIRELSEYQFELLLAAVGNSHQLPILVRERSKPKS